MLSVPEVDEIEKSLDRKQLEQHQPDVVQEEKDYQLKVRLLIGGVLLFFLAGLVFSARIF